jgi:hypothetical protein
MSYGFAIDLVNTAENLFQHPSLFRATHHIYLMNPVNELLFKFTVEFSMAENG